MVGGELSISILQEYATKKTGLALSSRSTEKSLLKAIGLWSHSRQIGNRQIGNR
jgi:hypothetical protein